MKCIAREKKTQFACTAVHAGHDNNKIWYKPLLYGIHRLECGYMRTYVPLLVLVFASNVTMLKEAAQLMQTYQPSHFWQLYRNRLSTVLIHHPFQGHSQDLEGGFPHCN